jgi:hypothetical protein
VTCRSRGELRLKDWLLSSAVPKALSPAALPRIGRQPIGHSRCNARHTSSTKTYPPAVCVPGTIAGTLISSTFHDKSRDCDERRCPGERNWLHSLRAWPRVEGSHL